MSPGHISTHLKQAVHFSLKTGGILGSLLWRVLYLNRVNPELGFPVIHLSQEPDSSLELVFLEGSSHHQDSNVDEVHDLVASHQLMRVLCLHLCLLELG